MSDLGFRYAVDLELDRASITVGPGKHPARIDAAAAASGLPSLEDQFRLAMVPRS